MFDYEKLLNIGQTMTDSLRHRGPDSSGAWGNAEQGIFLGHRRLAIQDLSAAGHQPMISNCGRYIIVYNGEIYNSVALKSELSNYKWHGHSDTEIILQACIEWGVDTAVRKFNGMFAFALYDQRDKQLYLVRDRIGIKPLYWGIHNDTLLFGSELKALVKHPHFTKTIDKEALSHYFQRSYIPAPLSIWQKIFKLKQGHYLRINHDLKYDEVCFWNLDNIIIENQKNHFSDYSDYVNEIESIIKDSVNQQLIADVPFGAFLSGGIDSSLVTAMMQKASSQRIKTFSIGFDEPQFNEAPFAKNVAKHLGTEHYEAYVTQQEIRNVIPGLAQMYDEPFADASQIPTYLLTKLTQQHVTVALSGDGGDELFAGYTRYLVTAQYWDKINTVPLSLRRLFAPLLKVIPVKLWSILFKIFMSTYRINDIPSKINLVYTLIQQSDLNAFYNQIVSLWPLDSDLVRGESFTVIGSDTLNLDAVSELQRIDIKTYLPDDILHKVDRASMASSLEVRVPLLDHRLVELSWRGQPHYKLSKGISKKPLRDILYKYVPQNLIDRPKMGFGIPIGQWLKSDLKEWAYTLLDASLIRQERLLDSDKIQNRLQQHQDGSHDWQASLWCCLMFQAWKKEWID